MYSQKSTESYFLKGEGSPPPSASATQKKLVTDEDSEAEKKFAKEQKQREKWKIKNAKGLEKRPDIAVKNKKNLKRIKKAENEKQNKKELWSRPKELNKNFEKVKEQTNEQKRN